MLEIIPPTKMVSRTTVIIIVVVVLIILVAGGIGLFLFLRNRRGGSGGIGCTAADYYNTPGDAIAGGVNLAITGSLSLDLQNRLQYKRVPKNSCSPGTDQTVLVPFPQQCSFTNPGGTGIVLGRIVAGSTGSSGALPVASYTISGGSEIAVAFAHCRPTNTAQFTSGIPVPLWS